ncbi:unnamed protein product [Pleuronectes platessa]|uniref:Uncharacterized protein n=1 Tax=Pleuronectes platessa TaxID=8262 RepID=A0A9N7YN91_PLEPL|nr:unnamed protein product [Pleuronectes platessa]
MGDYYTGGGFPRRVANTLESSCDDHQRNRGVCVTEEVSEPDLVEMSQDAREVTNSLDDEFSSCGADVSVPELLPGRSPTSPSLPTPLEASEDIGDIVFCNVWRTSPVRIRDRSQNRTRAVLSLGLKLQTPELREALGEGSGERSWFPSGGAVMGGPEVKAGPPLVSAVVLSLLALSLLPTEVSCLPQPLPRVFLTFEVFQIAILKGQRGEFSMGKHQMYGDS